MHRELTHGFTIDPSECRGCLACMRSCPTHAIRVKNGKARYLPLLCVDCGHCLRVCSGGAIRPATLPFAELDKFKFKVAVPSPVLLSQFPMQVSTEQIIESLKAIGFDAVWNYEVELAMVNRAVIDYIDNWPGPFPLISNYCPVVVRLIQVSYPEMVGQLINVQPPRELAGMQIKRKYSQELGIDPGEIAAIYITPCQAKTISILEPAERAKSYLDGALGISDVYNDILATVRALQEQNKSAPARGTRTSEMIRWTNSRCLDQDFSRFRFLTISGLRNIIQVFDDIEKGKLRNVQYLECWTCWDGCIGGNLTVDDVYITRSRIQQLLARLPERDHETEAEVSRRISADDLSLRGELKPRALDEDTPDLRERVKRMETEQAISRALPGLNCGLCGAPTCDAHARDIAWDHASRADCVFLSDERIKELRKIYLRKK